jgi:hypothetical protein
MQDLSKNNAKKGWGCAQVVVTCLEAQDPEF